VTKSAPALDLPGARDCSGLQQTLELPLVRGTSIYWHTANIDCYVGLIGTDDIRVLARLVDVVAPRIFNRQPITS
jgi:hypothetical protein